MAPRPAKTSKQLGAFAERATLLYLQFAGLKLVTKNFTSRLGEIDLIMLQPASSQVVQSIQDNLFRRTAEPSSPRQGQNENPNAMFNERSNNTSHKNSKQTLGHKNAKSREAVLVFVEVRYRRTNNYGTPAQTVSATKQKRIVQTAKIFLQQHPKWRDHRCRFDVVGVEQQKFSKRFNWYKGAFEAI